MVSVFSFGANYSVGCFQLCVYTADSILTMQAYCDLVVLRHPEPGAAKVSRTAHHWSKLVRLILFVFLSSVRVLWPVSL